MFTRLRGYRKTPNSGNSTIKPNNTPNLINIKTNLTKGQNAKDPSAPLLTPISTPSSTPSSSPVSTPVAQPNLFKGLTLSKPNNLSGSYTPPSVPGANTSSLGPSVNLTKKNNARVALSLKNRLLNHRGTNIYPSKNLSRWVGNFINGNGKPARLTGNSINNLRKAMYNAKTQKKKQINEEKTAEIARKEAARLQAERMRKNWQESQKIIEEGRRESERLALQRKKNAIMKAKLEANAAARKAKANIAAARQTAVASRQELEKAGIKPGFFNRARSFLGRGGKKSTRKNRRSTRKNRKNRRNTRRN